MSDTLTEEQVVRALDRLAKGWPDNLELFSWSGSLTLIDRNLSERGAPVAKAAIIKEWGSEILNDGGDPDWGG